MELNLVDIGIFVIFLFFLIKGYQAGFINQVTTILGIILGIYVAVNNYKDFSNLLLENFNLTTEIARLFSFVMFVIVVSLVISYLGFLLNKLTNIVFLSTVDSIAGGLFGLIKAFLIVYILLLVLINLPIENFQQELDESYFSEKFFSMNPVFEEHIERFTD